MHGARSSLRGVLTVVDLRQLLLRVAQLLLLESDRRRQERNDRAERQRRVDGGLQEHTPRPLRRQRASSGMAAGGQVRPPAKAVEPTSQRQWIKAVEHTRQRQWSTQAKGSGTHKPTAVEHTSQRQRGDRDTPQAKSVPLTTNAVDHTRQRWCLQPRMQWKHASQRNAVETRKAKAVSLMLWNETHP